MNRTDSKGYSDLPAYPAMMVLCKEEEQKR